MASSDTFIAEYYEDLSASQFVDDGNWENIDRSTLLLTDYDNPGRSDFMGLELDDVTLYSYSLLLNSYTFRSRGAVDLSASPIGVDYYTFDPGNRTETGGDAGNTFSLYTTIIGSDHADTLSGFGRFSDKKYKKDTGYPDIIYAGDGNDSVFSDDGNDIILGQRSNDTLSGGEGADILFGGLGDDVLDGGVDTIEDLELTRDDHLFGGTGDDILINGQYMWGGEGEDVLSTGAFNGAQNYMMAGGEGRDRFVIGVGSRGGVEAIGSALDFGAIAADVAWKSAAAIVGTATIGETVLKAALVGMPTIIEGAKTFFSNTGADPVSFPNANVDGFQIIDFNPDTEFVIAPLNDAGQENIRFVESTALSSDVDVYVVDGADNTLKLMGTITFSDDSSAAKSASAKAAVIDRLNATTIMVGEGNLNYGDLTIDDFESALDEETLDDLNDLSAGRFLLFGAYGSIEYFGDGTDNAIYGANYDDVLSGWDRLDGAWNDDGDDTLKGFGGNDLLSGGGGSNVIDGGGGEDAAVYQEAQAGVYVDLTAIEHTAVGASSVDSGTYAWAWNGEIEFNVDGTLPYDLAGLVSYLADNDVDIINYLTASSTGTGFDLISKVENVIGSDHDDTIIGSADDDAALLGEAGNDSIMAMAGDDTLYTSLGSDTLDGGDGTDTLAFLDPAAGASVNLLLNAVIDDGNGVSHTVLNLENIIGTSFEDSLIGDDNANMIETGNGGGTVRGFGGADTLTGGGGQDTIFGLDGDDRISGGRKADRLVGGDGNDKIFGDAGNDALSGGAGKNGLYGGVGDDFLTGTGSFDTLQGGSGADLLNAPGSGNLMNLVGGLGNDSLLAGSRFGYLNVVGQGGSDSLTWQLSEGFKDTYSVIIGDYADPSASTGEDDLTIDLAGMSVRLTLSVEDLGSATDWVVVYVDGSRIAQFIDIEEVSLTNVGGSSITTVGSLSAAGVALNTVRVSGADGHSIIDNSRSTDDVRFIVDLGDGDDTIFGGPGDDIVRGGDGSDIKHGGGGHDTFIGTLQHFIDDGHIADFHADETIIIEGYTGGVAIGDTGDGHIEFVFDGGRLRVEGHLSADEADRVAVETVGDDTIITMLPTTAADPVSGGGSNAADRIYGSDFADTLLGLAGDDTLDGHDGDDEVVGAGGEDIVRGEDGDDTISGGRGEDFGRGGNGADHMSGGGGGDTLDGGYGNDNVRGGAGDDMLDGGNNDDRLRGGGGDDSIGGSHGDDDLAGGAGDDSLSGGDGVDDLQGGRGADGLSGNAGDDRLRGQEGDDTLAGKQGDDKLDGGRGEDWLAGNRGNDILLGGAGDDTLAGGGGRNLLVGGEGADVHWIDPHAHRAGNDVALAFDFAADSIGMDVGAVAGATTGFAARVRALGGDRDAVIGALDGSSAWSVVGTYDDLAVEHGAGSLTLRKVDGRPFDSFADLSDHLLFTGLDDFLASL